MDSKYEEFYGIKCTAETAQAILCEGIEDEPEWVPRSVIAEHSEVRNKDDEGTLSVAEWFAKKRGWI